MNKQQMNMTQPTALEARSSQQLLFYFHDVWLHSAMLRTLGKKVAGWIPRIGASLCGVLPLSVRVLQVSPGPILRVLSWL